MLKFKLLPILFLVVNCANQTETNERTVNLEIEIDEELRPFYDEFIADAEYYGVKYDLDFSSVKYYDKLTKNTGAIATCWYGSRIEVLRRFVSDIRVKATLYHELGHCALKLDHNPNYLNEIQLMNPYEIGNEQYLLDNWSELVKTLMLTKPTFRLNNAESID